MDQIAHQCISIETLDYFDCLKLLDELEFHVLDRIDDTDAESDLSHALEQANDLHAILTAAAQKSIDVLIEAVCDKQLSASALRRLFNQYAQSIPDGKSDDLPDYDFFDDFLCDLFQVDIEPMETRRRTAEMLYLQPTPGRVTLDLINRLAIRAEDRFYDLGSGLGGVPILVSLLTEASAVASNMNPLMCNIRVVLL